MTDGTAIHFFQENHVILFSWRMLFGFDALNQIRFRVEQATGRADVNQGNAIVIAGNHR